MKTAKDVLLIIALGLLLVSCGNNRPFDSTAWLQADQRTRGRMCEDLVKSKILIGKPVEEAQRLLGRPDVTYPSALSYKIDLGWPLKGPEHYGLQVHLDDRRHVREVRIVD